jgi:hypothetical protein
MLTKERRMKAVPTLLNCSEDPANDSRARSWVFPALRITTGESLGSYPSVWRNQWVENAAVECFCPLPKPSSRTPDRARNGRM